MLISNIDKVEKILKRYYALRTNNLLNDDGMLIRFFLNECKNATSPEDKPRVDRIVELYNDIRNKKFGKLIINGELVDIQDTVILDGKRILRGDLPTSAYFCDICNEWHDGNIFPPATLHYADSNVVGQFCNDRTINMKNSVYTCHECGNYVYGDFYDNDGLCYECRNRVAKYKIKRYHERTQLHYYDMDADGRNIEVSNNNFQGYGLELEIDNGGEDNKTSEETIKLLGEEIYTMHDGSLGRGFEIITHPHTERALYNMPWEDTFKWLIKKGYRSHNASTCGLHMHISRTLFKDAHSLARLIYFYDKFRPDIVKLSRRTDSTANRWARAYNSLSTVTRERCEDIVDRYDRNCSHDMRYYAVNIQNSNTVEIRIMRGTLKLETFLADLDFMITTVNNANRMTWDDVNNIQQWLQGLKPETMEYLTSRGLFMNNTPNTPNTPDKPYKPIELEQGVRVYIDPTMRDRVVLPDDMFRVGSPSARIVEVNDPERLEDETEVTISQEELNNIRRRIECA